MEEKCICGKEVAYRLTLDEEVYCPHCNYLKYEKRSQQLNLCDLECEELYCWLVDYEQKGKEIIASYCLEKDECNQCGRRDFPEVIFKGVTTKEKVKKAPHKMKRRKVDKDKNKTQTNY